MPDYREDMFFFDGASGVPLLGFLTRPQQGAATEAIVYVHPFAEEKNCAHAIIAKAAREFASAGICVFRFDLSGCGDSGGEMTDFTLQDWLHDIDAAIRQVQQRTKAERVWLWGLRLGAHLALSVAAQDQRIRGLVLWQPVMAARQFVQQFLRRQIVADMGDAPTTSLSSMQTEIKAGGVVEVNGYPLTEPLYSSFAAIDSQALMPPPGMAVLLLSISQMETASPALTNYANKMSAHSDCDFRHVVEEPFWDRYWRWQSVPVINETKNWLLSRR